MGFHCCVPMCNSNSKKGNSSFHSFPKNPQLIKKWVHVIKRDTIKSKRNPKPFSVTAYTKICSLHFQKSDYLIRAEKCKLKPGAVPTVFPWVVQKDIRRCRSEPLKAALSIPVASELKPSGSNANEIALSVTTGSASVSEAPEQNPSTSEDSTLFIEDYRKKYCKSLIEIQNLKLQLKKACSETVQQKENKNNQKAFCKSDNQRQEISLFKNIASGQLFTIDAFKFEQQKICYYTGFPDYEVFEIVFNLLVSDISSKKHIKMKYTSNLRAQKLDLKDQFLLTLIKLRQGFGYEHLSTLFGISIATVGNIFVSWINFMYIRLGGMNIWPHRDILLANAPSNLKNNVIGSMDATEFFIQTPTSLIIQSQTYSQYKSHNTLKGFIVIDNNGAIIFISSLFTGCISDNKLVEECAFLDLIKHKVAVGELSTGDTFLADKGFTIQDLVKPVEINIPVFKSGTKFTAAEVNHTRTIAHERIHVERAIGRVKSYKILGNEVPISLLGTFNQVWTVCCLLCNFRMPLRSENLDL